LVITHAFTDAFVDIISEVDAISQFVQIVVTDISPAQHTELLDCFHTVGILHTL
jgi:hypothetical protein